jgi:hypothetical protein
VYISAITHIGRIKISEEKDTSIQQWIYMLFELGYSVSDNKALSLVLHSAHHW